jgi:hypothetical protein
MGMDYRDEPKRLVLIGIHKKGDKGFKKRIDNQVTLNQTNALDELLLIAEQARSRSSRIINLLPD